MVGEDPGLAELQEYATESRLNIGSPATHMDVLHHLTLPAVRGCLVPPLCIRCTALGTIGFVVAAAFSHLIGQAVQSALPMFNTLDPAAHTNTSNVTN
jgi:hypothetical protein